MQTVLRDIYRRASLIAGACWDDREETGTLGDQLRAVALTKAIGSDGDLTSDDRENLHMLADEADEVDRLKALGVCPTCQGDESLACPDC